MTAGAMLRATRSSGNSPVPGRPVRRPATVALIVAAAALGALAAGAATEARAQAGAVETFHVQGNVHMLVGAGANVAVQIGEDGVLVVDTGARESRAEVLAAIRRLTDEPIRWIINTHDHVDHTGGNETLSQAGMTVNGNPAAIIGHENTLMSMHAAGRPMAELPLNSFFEPRRDFYFNGEAVFIEHVPDAHSGGDVMVYFRGSDVLVTGDLFVTTHYPIIELDAGGGVDGFIAGLNRMLDITVPARLQEGGTYVIPGHGRVGDEADVLEYRDMVVILRDRIAHMIGEGMNLEQIAASEPTLDYDTRYDRVEGPGGKAHFVEAMYADLTRRSRQE
jgi:cyclase